MQAASSALPSSLVAVLSAMAHTQPDATAYTFLHDGQTPGEPLTYGELDRQARAIAAHLQDRGATGERVLLLFPTGPEYVAAFFGCLYAGAIALPTQLPMKLRNWGRVQSIVADARPKLALATAETLAQLQAAPPTPGLEWEPSDTWAQSGEDSWHLPELGPGTLAFLQYTSGSTSLPKGVMVSHGNLLHNLEMIKTAWSLTERDVIVSWLPLFHDMGLIGNMLLAVYLGASAYLMSPLDFLRRPLRWLEAIARYRGTYSGGPNFAYDLCLKRISPQDRESLRLGSWKIAYNGAEPVRMDTLRRFAETFGPCGLRAFALKPVYGLAEATVFVTGGELDEEPQAVVVAEMGLASHRVDLTAGDPGRTLAGCGRPWSNQRVVIVDPERGLRCPADRVGEIWVAGESIAQGYWQRPEATEETFRARLADTGEGPFLRTGDLGFLHAGHLMVTGRLKDLVIFRGRNLYPQDLEQIAEESHASLRAGCSAAFTIEVEGEERPVLVLEVERRQIERPEPTAGNREAMVERLDRFMVAPQPLIAQEVIGTVREAVFGAFEVPLHDVVLIKATSLPKTTSGKVQRRACRSLYLEGTLELIKEEEWN